jgi:amino-acid N-acetyltransferase
VKTAVAVRKAKNDEINTIHEIISSYASDGILLARSPDDISATLDNFYISEEDGTITGVITFFDYGESLKEVRSLAVRKSHLRRGIGTSLLAALIRELQSRNHPRIFVLTYAPLFFEKNGFVGIDREKLPEKIWKDCATCKNRLNCSETALIYAGE